MTRVSTDVLYPALLSSVALLAACGGRGDPADPLPPAVPPTITSLSAPSGIGTAPLKIAGTNFAATASVRIGGEPARVVSATPTLLTVDLCVTSPSDCEPRGALAGGGSFPVTVTQGSDLVTATQRYFVYTSATFLAGDWRTATPANAVGIVTRIDSVATNARIVQGLFPFSVGDTVNRGLTRAGPYRWDAEGLLINEASGARRYTGVTIAAIAADSISIDFSPLSGISIRVRVNPVR